MCIRDRPSDGYVLINVYDMLGNLVKNLVSQNQSSGYKMVQWNATDDRGYPASAGIYFYSIEVRESMHTKKMILLK